MFLRQNNSISAFSRGGDIAWFFEKSVCRYMAIIMMVVEVDLIVQGGKPELHAKGMTIRGVEMAKHQ